MAENMAKQQAEKAVILVQGSLILFQGLKTDYWRSFHRIISELMRHLQ